MDYWIWDLVALICLMVATVVLYALKDWDPVVTRLFYFPDMGEKPFFLHQQQPWKFFYHYISVPIIIVILMALITAAVSLVLKQYRKLRIHCLFIILAFILGPGVVINAGLKAHWGRPRPVNVEIFGGRQEYHKPLEPGVGGKGKSFPSGHSSAGYALSVFYFIWRRKKILPWAALAASVVFGSVVGMGRMMAGAHFLSDIIWSGYLVFLVNGLLYYFVLKIPYAEDHPAEAARGRRHYALMLPALVLLAIAVLVGVLFATPFHREVRDGTRSLQDGDQPYSLKLYISHSDVNLSFAGQEAMTIHGSADGFGWANNDLTRSWQEFDEEKGPVIVYHYDRDGIFTEWESTLDIIIPYDNIEHIYLHLHNGLLTAETPEKNMPPLHIKLDGARARLPETWAENVEVEIVEGEVVYRP